MYVLRSALRASTGRPPARFIRGRRYPSPPRLRSFNTTRILAQTGKPPSGSDSTSVGHNDAADPDSIKAAAKGHEDSAITSEDPELLAQKIQRSRETTRRCLVALRRQHRSKKSEGLPPVYVPDWFLRRRVIRREDTEDNAGDRPRPASLAVTVSDSQSGEQATCAIPAPGDMDAAQVLSWLVRGLWKHRLDDQEKRKIEKYLGERKTLIEWTGPKDAGAELQDRKEADGSDTTPPLAIDGQSPAAEDTDFSALGRRWKALLTDSWAAMYNEAEQTDRRDILARRLNELEKQINRPETIQHDSTWTSQQKREAILEKKEARLEKWFKRSMASRKTQHATIPRPISPLILAEIRATVVASLSALRPSGDSFPAAKTNLILHAPAAGQEAVVDEYIYGLAEELRSDLIVLTAQDLAQLGGDYLGEGSEPTPRSIRSLGYETYRLSSDLDRALDTALRARYTTEEPEGMDLTSSGETTEHFSVRAFTIPLPLDSIRALAVGGKSFGFPGVGSYGANANVNANANANVMGNTDRTLNQSETRLEDIKLAALLDTLLDAEELKQHRGLVREDTDVSFQRSSIIRPISAPGFFDYSVDSDGTDLELNSALPLGGAGADISMNVGIVPSTQSALMPERPKIVYVKDFKELNATHYGGRIIQKLEELVRKRSLAGESIMIIGSSCSRDLTPELSASGVRGLQSEGESSFFRTIVVEGDSGTEQPIMDDAVAAIQAEFVHADVSPHELAKYRRINLSHIREMLRSLDPAAAEAIAHEEGGPRLLSKWASIFPPSYFNRILTYDEVHRIALTALGLYVTSPTAKVGDKDQIQIHMSWAHVILAMGLIRASDNIKYAAFEKLAELAKRSQNLEQTESLGPGAKTKAKKKLDPKSMQRQRELQQIAQNATKYEQRLMPGIADANQIKTTFDQVHVSPKTIDSIRTITSLSLLRPDAFSYGILATEKISGALLYGPPGTGKTLLAKAVAKESGSTVLEVSGAQIMGKYVGESEKNVAAIFSLAQKLSPCIVFLDEADSIFGSRNAFADRTGSHRQTLNQFLKEWDGLNNSQVFVMVATNRPFDLDDAVIRRLPRRLLVDLPTEADRKEILRIHTNGEQLDESVDLEDLAKRTPFYSGSDLKNVVVSAALACVKEENDQAALAAAKATLETDTPAQADAEPSKDLTDVSSKTIVSPEPSTPSKIPHLVRGGSYSFPEKRILHLRHFDKALQEISASISEDMSSLNAIKKFDREYGDRKGKKLRREFGFGAAQDRNESAARVRV